MTKEFNLTKRIGFVEDFYIMPEEQTHIATRTAICEVEDVKEFIKKLKENIRDSKKILRLQVPFIWDEIEKLAGEELKK